MPPPPAQSLHTGRKTFVNLSGSVGHCPYLECFHGLATRLRNSCITKWHFLFAKVRSSLIKDWTYSMIEKFRNHLFLHALNINWVIIKGKDKIMELYSFSHMEKPQLMFYIKLSADSCRRIVITGKRRTITNVNLWHDDGCVVLTETKGGKNKKHRFTGCLVLWNSPSSMAHCPSISVCLRYESSIVGS